MVMRSLSLLIGSDGALSNIGLDARNHATNGFSARVHVVVNVTNQCMTQFHVHAKQGVIHGFAFMQAFFQIPLLVPEQPYGMLGVPFSWDEYFLVVHVLAPVF